MGGEYFNYAEARILELEAQVKEAREALFQCGAELVHARAVVIAAENLHYEYSQTVSDSHGNSIQITAVRYKDREELDEALEAYRSHYPGGE